MRHRDVDVLIIGGGPVGTALAIELGSHGIRCEVIERRTSSTPQPKAKLTNVRTMTLLRRWQLADEVRAASPLPRSFPSDVAFVTRLTGWELFRFPNALSTATDRERPYPEAAQQVPQDVLERVLRNKARGLPTVTWSAGVTAEKLEVATDGVVVDAVERANRYQIRCRYLAGCDGARSLVRRELGIGMDGDELLAHNVSAVFRAPTLASLHGKAAAVHYWTVNADTQAILGPLNGVDTWWFHLLNAAPDASRMSADEVRQHFYRAVGREFPCDVLAHGPWRAQRLLAQRYRTGPAFLLGDAAHLHPPTGGYGMNMGIGDAVDLGWKLAAVLQGWGGEGLLDSYEAERRPVHKRVVDEAARNYATQLEMPGLEDTGPLGDRTRRQVAQTVRAEKVREFAGLGVQLGYRYERSPIVVPDGSAPTPDEVSGYVPSARPGHLVPHLWVDERQCLYDLLGPGFTLLRLGPAVPDAARLVQAAIAAGVPLKVLDLPDSKLFGASLVLVRPDQHVAWRGEALGEPEALVNVVRGATSTQSTVVISYS